MGIKALNLEAIERYVSKKDHDYRPDGKHLPGATTFLLGTIDSIQLAALRDDLASYTEDGGMRVRGADNDLLACRMALRGWEGFDAKFECQETFIRGHKWMLATEDCVRKIPFEIMREIGGHVKVQNQFDEDEEKNSDSASSPSTSTQNETAPDAQPQANDDGDATPKGKSPPKAE